MLFGFPVGVDTVLNHRSTKSLAKYDQDVFGTINYARVGTEDKLGDHFFNY